MTALGISLRKACMKCRARMVVYMVLGLGLVACGETADVPASTDGQANTTVIDGSGAPVPTLAIAGPIEGFGSVIVNGVHYDTGKADILIDGLPADEAELALGDFIHIEASRSAEGSWQAARILAETAVEGPIGAIDRANQTITVLNHRIHIADDTLWDEMGMDIDALEKGDWVSVKGANAFDGTVQATRIEQPLQIHRKIVVSGRVTLWSLEQQRFTLGGLQVDTQGLADLGSLRNDLLVTIEGELLPELQQVRATKWRLIAEPGNQVAAAIAFETQGSLRKSAAGWQLGIFTLTLSATTRIEGGSLNDLREGAWVTVSGSVKDRVLEADVIRLKPQMSARWVGVIVGLQPAEQGGRFGLMQIEVTANTPGSPFGAIFDVQVDAQTILAFYPPSQSDREADFERLRLGDSVTVIVSRQGDSWLARLITVNLKPLTGR
jgi:hypothetical protein